MQIDSACSHSPGEPLNIRDNLAVQALGWRQLVYDAPEENLPEVKRLFEHMEIELKRLAKKQPCAK